MFNCCNKRGESPHGFADAGFKLWLLPDKIAVALGILKGEHGAVGHLLQAAHRHVVGLHLLIGTFRVVGTENDGRMADADGGILLLHQRLVVKDEAGRRRVRRRHLQPADRPHAVIRPFDEMALLGPEAQRGLRFAHIQGDLDRKSVV